MDGISLAQDVGTLVSKNEPITVLGSDGSYRYQHNWRIKS